MKKNSRPNLAVFLKTFFDAKWSILLYCLIFIVYVAMMTSFFPSIADQSEQFQEIMNVYPESFVKGFGIDLEMFTTIEGFLGIEYFKIIWVIVIAIMSFSFGASLIAKELDKGTSDFTFTLPLLRQRIVINKFLGYLLISIFIIAVSIYSAAVAAILAGEKINLAGWSLFFAVGVALGFFLLALTAFFSSLFSSKGKVYAIMTAILIGSYLLDFLAGLNERAKDFHCLSFFKYLGDIPATLKNGSLEIENLLFFLLAGLLFFAASLVVSEKRDL